jgi:hypothetical protein
MTRPGTWDLELDGDFRVADGWEPVYLIRQNADATYADAVGPIFALREALNKRSVAGQMEAADVVWHLDASEPEAGTLAPDGVTEIVGVGAEGVRAGDRIRDAADVLYSVTGATLEGATDQYRCPSIKVP